MKPDNWDEMAKDEKRDIVTRLASSVRGNLIIGQALAKAVALMRKEQYPETSNIEDMEMLGEVLFHPFYSMYGPEQEAARQEAFEAFKAGKAKMWP